MAPQLGSEHIQPEHSHSASMTWAEVVATPSKEPSPEKCTDTSNDDAGPGPQPLRGGGMTGFPSQQQQQQQPQPQQQQQQQQSQARNASIPPSRLPNGKLGAFVPLENEPVMCVAIGS